MDGIKWNKRDFFFAYNMILDLPLSEHAKMVYICLCRFADGDNRSFPSHINIGKKCGIKSRTTVKNAINALMEAGLLDYKTRKEKNGGQTSNLYTIYSEPNEAVKKKYAGKLHGNMQTSVDTPCSTGGHPPVQQMDTPCPADGHPPVQQMDTPCPADGHEVYPSKNTHLKNIQSINQDGGTDHSDLFEKTGVDRIHHTEQIGYVRSTLSDLLQTGRVGKSHLAQTEICAAIGNLTPEIIDSVLDRFLKRVAQGRVPRPMDYLKTCFISAGRDAVLRKTAGPADKDHTPTYDMEDYVNLSMRRLLEKEG